MFEVIDPVIGVEKDGVITNIRPWKAENVALVPDGILGTIHNSLAMEELMPVPEVKYAKYQNILISKWFENNPFGEYTLGEWNAFPGFELIEQCYILTTDSAA
jgi:hypothetical protein